MKTATQRDYEQRILRVLVHIQTHLDHSLDLEALAALAHFSPFHFHRVFRGMVGEPVAEHVRRLRLERAAQQLKTTGRAITQIAFDAGYETHEAFTRAFRTAFRESPAAYRDGRRRAIEVAAPSGVHFAPHGASPDFASCRKDEGTMNARIEERKPMRVAFMRHVGPYNEVGATWQKLMGWAFSRGMFGGMGKILAVVHDDPEVTPPERLRYDACLGVDAGFTPEGDVGVQEVPGGRYAVAVHQGPYERLNETYAGLMGQWLPAHDQEPADGPCLEVYLNNPQQTPPDQLLTEVYVPLRTARC